ncbi:MAG: HD domain-containing protein [Candidatus Tectomicrobia bacterium]|uniref:HD domain-containing protein n=1 Tax=Tectimicrobiota bacterium TaxID=2528274 RepID=A0A932GPD6_UNCTE|nr:HD domain-containing protein [Candidatus Tectomicrobia bacterium]
MKRLLPLLPSSSGESPALSPEDKYVPIRLDSVQNNTELDFDLYLENSKNGRKRLYRSRDLVFQDKHRERLLENNVSVLFISRDDVDKYYAYVESHLGTLVSNPDVVPKEKASILYETSIHRIHQILEDPERPENIDRSLVLVDHTIYFLINEERALESLLETMSFDYSTYTHSMNVCALSVLLAQRHGIDDQETLKVLGIGGLLHDVGKSKINPDVLFKKGPLNNDEWKLIKEHPAIGYDLLKAHELIPKRSLSPVRHHHERSDGSGYPDGLPEESIDILASIVRVSDIFDAITTNRCYKKAAPAFEALNIMKDEMKSKRDKEIFQDFIMLLGPKRSKEMLLSH